MTNPQRLLEQRSAVLAQPCGYADVAQLVERWLPKPKVAGSRPVVRFSLTKPKAAWLRYSWGVGRWRARSARVRQSPLYLQLGGGRGADNAQLAY
jgi:hypothetical protein